VEDQSLDNPKLQYVDSWQSELFYLTLSLGTILQYISSITGNNTFISEVELEDLCRACGLVDFRFVRNGFYIMFAATKPI
jgi:hypothetical protein